MKLRLVHSGTAAVADRPSEAELGELRGRSEADLSTERTRLARALGSVQLGTPASALLGSRSRLVRAELDRRARRPRHDDPPSAA